MLKKCFLLLTLMILALGLAVPASRVSASGANRVDFTAVSVDICAQLGPNENCNPGQYVPLPNGKGFVVGYKTVIQFTATDPRWNAVCNFTGDPFPPGNPNAYPVTGSFVCTPTDPAYAGGWWVGSVLEVFHPDKAKATWHGKGYGTLDRLEVIAYNTLSNHYADAAEGVTDVGTIIELPGYQP